MVLSSAVLEGARTSLLWCLDLEEGMRMLDFSLTGLTVVEVITDAALVAYTNEWEHVASVTSHSGVNSDSLLRFFRLSVLDQFGDFRDHTLHCFLNELTLFLLAFTFVEVAETSLLNLGPIDDNRE